MNVGAKPPSTTITTIKYSAQDVAWSFMSKEDFTPFSTIGDEIFMYIVFEGINGCGKTTALNNIYNKMFCNYENTVKIMKEPSQKVKAFIEDNDFDDREMALIYALDRKLNQSDYRIYQKNKEKHLFTDRCLLSSFVYQSREMKYVEKLNQGYVEPDLVLFFKCNPQTAKKRVEKRDGKVKENLDFMNILYTELFDVNPLKLNYVVIDADKSKEEVKQQVREALLDNGIV